MLILRRKYLQQSCQWLCDIVERSHAFVAVKSSLHAECACQITDAYMLVAIMFHQAGCGLSSHFNLQLTPSLTSVALPGDLLSVALVAKCVLAVINLLLPLCYSVCICFLRLSRSLWTTWQGHIKSE